MKYASHFIGQAFNWAGLAEEKLHALRAILNSGMVSPLEIMFSIRGSWNINNCYYREAIAVFSRAGRSAKKLVELNACPMKCEAYFIGAEHI